MSQNNEKELEEKILGQKVIDNRNVKMLDAIRFFLKKPDTRSLDMAVGYFYISGALMLKEEFVDFMDHKNGRIRILMGNQTDKITTSVLDKKKDYFSYMVEESKKDISEISNLDFLEKFEGWLENGQIEVKVYTGDANYFHAKSYLFANYQESLTGAAIVGSSNFSKSGLEGNTELNVFTSDAFYPLHTWYTNLWLSNEVDQFSLELIDIVKNKVPVKKKKHRYQTVKKTYYDYANIFAKPFTELNETKEWVKELYPHQRSGVIAIKDKLDSFNTAILSDGVGLGKTRTAAGVIRLYLESENVCRILILVDAKLHNQWEDELRAVGVPPKNCTFMSRDKFVSLPLSEIDKMKYTLVVIDEAHLGFKNNSTRAYRKMFYLKKNNPGVKGLLMTATPWNNRRDDVINLGMLFLNPDAVPNDREYKQYMLIGGISNKVVKSIAKSELAFNQFWTDLFLQRTRKTYGGKNVTFPHREFPTVDIKYEPKKDAIFSDNFDAIAKLNFPYMDPIKYIFGMGKEDIGGKQLKLILLKRADSSWYAYKNSLTKIVDRLNELEEHLDYIMKDKYQELTRFKEYLREKYKINGQESDQNFSDFRESEDDDEHSILSKARRRQYIENMHKIIDSIKPGQAEYVVEQMRVAASQDKLIVNDLIDRLDAAYSRHDEKVEKISELVKKELDKGHKVIVISQFADTVKYYYDYLYKYLNGDTKNIAYPMAIITGGNSRNNANHINKNVKLSKKKILERFSPKSKRQIELLRSEDEINLLVGTDTISTGQNLQDAVTLMNIDLPYNPMQLEQRIGRIDRPRDEMHKNKKNIYIYTFPVYASIDGQLKMSKRLGKKIEGVLSDTEFDNPVLPEYQEYLKNAKKMRGKAVEKMLNDTLSRTIYSAGMQAEEHSEDYKEANKRMYQFKANGVVSSPITVSIPNYSFSKGQDDSIAVVKVTYHDVNGAEISIENVVVNLSIGKVVTITEGENNIYREIGHDCENYSPLKVANAQSLVDRTNEVIKKVVNELVNKYNERISTLTENVNTLKDRTSQKAALNIMNSTKDAKNYTMIMSQLKAADLRPNEVAPMTKYIETIGPEDELYPIVQEIAADVNQFWMNLTEYKELFSPENLKIADKLQKSIKRVDTRKADSLNTETKVIAANIVVDRTLI
ncbi:phospholipase D-like domain-containing protein [Limosilactobacillus mucosae]|uniref:helicase-related protein n=1 Tax=Limosilactobacillus mucosae TaxID=97478 RepID=UPI00233F48B3|nr:helicase-related protein [Limosilactobacillus mucosae]MDC2844306.1 phospholipase D-like domain-containing protein [Limosilactobacillus mucosae]